MKNLTLVLIKSMVLILVICHVSFAQTTVVMWNFDDQDITADGGIPANLSKLAQNTSSGPYTFPIGIGGTGFACSSNGWDGYYNYWLIDFATTGYYSITVSSIQRSSATGPRDFKIQYGFSSSGPWTDLPGATLITLADNYTSGVVSNVPLPSACDNQPDVFLRWIMVNGISVAGGSVGSAGTSRMENLYIMGNPPAPVNDNCPGTMLSVNSVCAPVTGTTVSSTQTLSEYSGDDDDVWYALTPAGTTATVEVSGSAGFDPVLNFRDSSSCNAASIMYNNFTAAGGTERMRISGLTPGKTYEIRVFSAGTGAAAQGNFTVCAYPYTPGSNDDVSATVPILNIGGNAGQDNTFYGFKVGEPYGSTWLVSSDEPANSQWFQFIPAATSCYAVAATGFDTQLAIYTAGNVNDFNTFTQLASDDNTGPGNTGLISTISLTAGTTYFIQVNGYRGAIGTPIVTINQLAVGKTVAMAATSTGCAKFTANWGTVANAAGYYLDVSDDTFNTFVPGFQNLNVNNTSSYTVTGLNPGTTYQYRLRAYGLCSFTPLGAYSDTIVVTTAAGPGIPVFTAGDDSLCAGQGSTYTATAANATSITYSIVAGTEMIHPTLGIVTAASADFTVRATATDSCGSSTADLVVHVFPVPPKPVITFNPWTLSSNAVSGNQWYELNTGAISGATNQYYTTFLTGWYYDIVTLNGCSSEPSDTLYIFVEGLGKEVATNNLSIFPNPTTGMFTVSYDIPDNQNVFVEVINGFGQSVYAEMADEKSGHISKSIDLTGFSKGMYLVKIISGNKSVIAKIIVQ